MFKVCSTGVSISATRAGKRDDEKGVQVGWKGTRCR